jgi:hypothetical protein
MRCGGIFWPDRVRAMIWARNLGIVVIAIMSALAFNIVLVDGMGHGVGLDTFLAGTRNPWQMFINQDLVSGLLLTVSWIIYRQRGCRVIDTVAWVWMALWWGNIVVAAYIILAVAQSAGDPAGFFLGRRSARPLRPVWSAPSAALRAACVIVAVACAAYLLRGLRTASTGVAAVGYLLAFTPITLSALLLAMPDRRTALAPP